MKSLRPLFFLVAPALLLVGCDHGDDTSSSRSISPEETPSDTLVDASSTPGGEDSASTSSNQADIRLASFIEGVKSANYVVAYDDAYLGESTVYTYLAYYLDEETVVYETDYGDGYVDGQLVGNHDEYGMVEVYFADGEPYYQSLVSPAKGHPIAEAYYTPADFIGESSDWTADGSTYVCADSDLKAALLNYISTFDGTTIDDVADLVLAFGEDSVTLETAIEGAELTFVFTDIGAASYEGAEEMLSSVEFSAPSDWGVAGLYAEQFGIDFPSGYFGYGYTASVDDYFGDIEVTDSTADASRLLSVLQPLLEEAGFAFDETTSDLGENYYSYNDGDNWVDFYWITADEMDSPLYPNGYISILFYTLGY